VTSRLPPPEPGDPGGGAARGATPGAAPVPAGRAGVRAGLAVLVGIGLAAVLALILGEYPFTGLTPYLVAVAVPAIIGFATGGIVRGHAAARWAATGVLSAAGIAWALWISTGRGVDPVPAGGWAAIALALVWPVALAVVVARRRRAGPPTTGLPAGN
jgi:hypothetical protein